VYTLFATIEEITTTWKIGAIQEFVVIVKCATQEIAAIQEIAVKMEHVVANQWVSPAP